MEPTHDASEEWENKSVKDVNEKFKLEPIEFLRCQLVFQLYTYNIQRLETIKIVKKKLNLLEYSNSNKISFELIYHLLKIILTKVSNNCNLMLFHFFYL